MSINRNFADLAGDANADGASAVGNTSDTDLIQQQHLTAAAANVAAAGHNHDGEYLPANTGLNDLSDVSTAGVQDGWILIFQGGSWTTIDPGTL